MIRLFVLATSIAACSSSSPTGSGSEITVGDAGPAADGSSGTSDANGGGTTDGATCSSTSQCPGASSVPPEYFCVGSSGLPGCGGPALTGGCTTDADCAGDATLDMVCVDNPCIGAPFTGVCLPGCTGSCGLGQTCTAGHCIAAPCTTDGDCPANFACNANACQMKACQTDSQCTGFCVNDLCSAQAGVCVPAPT